MRDNYSYRARQEIRHPLKMNDKLLSGLVERLALSEPTEHRGPPNKRPFVQHRIEVKYAGYLSVS